MEREKAIVVFNVVRQNLSYDLELPLNISANELFVALNAAFRLGISTNDMKKYHFSCERPVALLRGDKPLKEFGICNGTVINYFG